MLIIFLLLIFISASSYWVYSHKLRGIFAQNSRNTHLFANLQSFIHRHKTIKDAAHTAKNQVQVAQQDEVHFDFYNELPKMQVNVPSVDNSKTTKTNAPALASSKKDAYILRLAEFKNESSASQLRLSLLLAGIDVEIVKKGEIYRVQQGVYPTLTQAKENQATLQKKGFESVLEKV